MTATLPILYQEIRCPLLEEKAISLTVKRMDLVHPELSGNKWYKLKYNIQEANKQGHQQLLTFGGAYSNHIYATAAAAKLAGIHAIGMIRGEEHLPLNPTLLYARTAGMRLEYLTRTEYRKKDSPDFLDKLKEKFGRFYLIPEGGTNALAVRGTREILEGKDLDYDFICTSVGTGGTFAGLVSTAHASQKVLGFSALKGDFIHQDIDRLLYQHQIHPSCDYEIVGKFHFGGYAKYNSELIDYIKLFKAETGIPLDPVYTGKMMYGIMKLIESGEIPRGSSVLVLHTGGLQGIKGFNARNNTNLPLT